MFQFVGFNFLAFFTGSMSFLIAGWYSIAEDVSVVVGLLVGLGSGILLNVPIMVWARKRRHLTRNATISALLMGLTLWLIEPSYYVALLGFLASSSVLSKIKASNKASVQEKFEKGGERDVVQTLANGGVAWFLSVLYLALAMIYLPPAPASSLPCDLVSPGGTVGAICLQLHVTVFASIAAVNADTWATEIGTIFDAPPRWILDLRRRVERGTSGGVSFKGTMSSIAGSIFIATLATIIPTFNNWENVLGPAGMLAVFITISASGFAGAMIDSLLGATVQGFFKCAACEKGTEKRVHCGQPTTLTRGIPWFRNDLVNFLSAAGASCIAFLVFPLLLVLFIAC